MAMWLHISAKNKTNVLQEGRHADSQGGAGFTNDGWQSEPHSPNTNVMCKRWDTLVLSYVSVLALKSKSPGGEIVTSENMPFGSSIILYYEDALTYKQLGAIKEAFERNKINVQLRGQDYWQSQILQRAATRKP